MNEIALVIHDGDGNLYDTIDHITRTTIAAFNAMGANVDEANVYERFSAGVSLHKIFEELGPELDPHTLEDQFYAFDSSLGYEGVHPSVGLFEMLETFAASGIRNAVASNREQSSTLAILRHLGIVENYIDAEFVACPPGHLSKPNPHQLQFLIKSAGILPNRAIMVGDTPGDIIAGKNAGVKATVGFTKGFGSEEALTEAGADLLIDDLSDLPAFVAELSQ